MINKENIVDYELKQYNKLDYGFIDTNNNSIFVSNLISCIDNGILFDEHTSYNIINNLNRYD